MVWKDSKSVPITEYMYQKASKAKIPLSGTFELTPMCNFSCKMCYVRKTFEEVRIHTREMLTLEHWLKIAEEAKNEGMLELLLTGGEPLLWPNFWKLYEKLSKMGFLQSINTNGSLIDEKAIEYFKQMPPKRINITLYGASDETYEQLCHVKNVFKKVDYAISELKRVGINVKLNGTLTPYNVKDLEKIVEYSKEKDLRLNITTYMFPPLRRDKRMIGVNERFTAQEAARYRLKSFYLQNGKDNYLKYLESIMNNTIYPVGLKEVCTDNDDGIVRCRAGRATFWITWDGWITPCGKMPDPQIELRKKKFKDAWKELVQVTSEIRLSGACEKCQNRMTCHSCAAMDYAETGRFSGIPKYLCEMTLEMRKIASEELANM